MRLLFLLLVALFCAASAPGQGRVPGGPTAAAPRPQTLTTPAPAAPKASAAPARESFAITVSGSITNAEGLPLPGATVWDSRTLQILAIANAEGEFTLTLPTNAAVQLTCGYAGLANQPLQIRQPHRRNDVIITLEPAAPTKAR